MAENSTNPAMMSNLSLNNSEDIFDSTASEIANTPIKSPVLGKSFRKTIFLTAKFNDSQIAPSIDEEEHELEEVDPLESTPDFQLVDPVDEPDSEPRIKTLITNVEDSSLLNHTHTVNVRTVTNETTDIVRERTALEDLLCDIDSDQSTYCMDRRNDSSPISDESGSRGSTVIKKKTTVSSSTLQKAKNSLQMPSKKSYSISSSDSSSSLGEKEQETKKAGSSEQLRRRNSAFFNVRKNRHYLSDAKLRERCHVILEQLPRSILKKYAKALDKSKKYVTNKKFHRYPD